MSMATVCSHVVYYYMLTVMFMKPIYGASTGAKGSACSNMYPGHSAATQNSSPPYKYSLSSTKYGCVSNITITLYSNDVKGFKGFLCQTRRDLNEYRTYGTLTSNNTTYTINKCDQTGSISHSNPTIKSSVTFIWTPPVIDVGELSIICTVVKEFSIFWMNVVSPAVTYSACPTSTNTPLSTSLSSHRTNSTPSSTQTSSVSTTASETLSTPVQTTPNTSKSPNISSTFTSKTITTSADLTTTESTSVNSASTFSEATSVCYITLYITQLYFIVDLTLSSL